MALCCSPTPDLSKAAYCHVASWADRYLDSGVSMAMDTAESAGSDYDSDNSRSSMETVHHSYSYIPSDVEVSAHVGSRHDRCDAAHQASFKTMFPVWHRYQK